MNTKCAVAVRPVANLRMKWLSVHFIDARHLNPLF
jgi:hypothetical protein